MISEHPDETYKEDMPLLKRFMVQLSVLPAAVILLALLLVVWLDKYLSRERNITEWVVR